MGIGVVSKAARLAGEGVNGGSIDPANKVLNLTHLRGVWLVHSLRSLLHKPAPAPAGRLALSLELMKHEGTKMISKAIIWTVSVTVVGLLQLWVLFVIYWSTSQLDQSKFHEILNGGGILFFSTSLVWSLGIDFFLSKRTTHNLQAVFLVYVAIPGIITVFSLIMFLVSSLSTPNIEIVKLVQAVILGFSLIYAFSLKSFPKAWR